MTGIAAHASPARPGRTPLPCEEHDLGARLRVSLAGSCGTVEPMRIGSLLLAAGVIGIAATAVSGCYTNSCLLTVCDGPYCRCSLSTCGHSDASETAIACDPTRIPSIAPATVPE